MGFELLENRASVVRLFVQHNHFSRGSPFQHSNRFMQESAVVAVNHEDWARWTNDGRSSVRGASCGRSGFGFRWSWLGRRGLRCVYRLGDVVLGDQAGSEQFLSEFGCDSAEFGAIRRQSRADTVCPPPISE